MCFIMKDEENITLIDEDGNEEIFTIIDLVEVDEKKYAVLVPPEDEYEGEIVDNGSDELEEEVEARILRIDTEDNGEQVLVTIDNDDEFEKVADAIEDLYDEEETE